MGIDRIRAKKPVRNQKDWTKGQIIETKNKKHVVVKNENGSKATLNVSESLFELFTSRMEGEVKGGMVWYQKKD